jgi:phosphoribosylformylglycinamidine (FGAM) synthase-like enzyme
LKSVHEGEEVADLPIKELGDEAPEYDRPGCRLAPTPGRWHADFAEPEDWPRRC